MQVRDVTGAWFAWGWGLISLQKTSVPQDTRQPLLVEVWAPMAAMNWHSFVDEPQLPHSELANSMAILSFFLASCGELGR